MLGGESQMEVVSFIYWAWHLSEEVIYIFQTHDKKLLSCTKCQDQLCKHSRKFWLIVLILILNPAKERQTLRGML